jgi:hypothetical protein
MSCSVIKEKEGVELDIALNKDLIKKLDKLFHKPFKDDAVISGILLCINICIYTLNSRTNCAEERRKLSNV